MSAASSAQDTSNAGRWSATNCSRVHTNSRESRDASESQDGYYRFACAALGGIRGVILRHADFTADLDAWIGADVVLAVATCFDDAQMGRLADGAARLRPGARVVTVDKQLPPNAPFALLARVECRGDWGPAVGYIQSRRDSVNTSIEFWAP